MIIFFINIEFKEDIKTTIKKIVLATSQNKSPNTENCNSYDHEL